MTDKYAQSCTTSKKKFNFDRSFGGKYSILQGDKNFVIFKKRRI